MEFKEWLVIEGSKELARQYAKSLKLIPQDPKHHPEGDVLTHIKLVRKSIPQAISYLLELKRKEPWSVILGDIDIVPDERQMEILKLAAWLHDIGKITATTITTDSGTRHWTEPGESGKIRSLKHEEPEFYQPEIDKFIGITPVKIKNLYEENRDLFDFLIQRHMDVSKGGFPKSFVAEYFKNGKLVPSEKIKMLLILIYSDKMGRKPQSQESISKNDEALVIASEKSKINTGKSQQQKFDNPETMLRSLKAKNIPMSQVYKAVRDKFNLSDDEISRIV